MSQPDSLKKVKSSNKKRVTRMIERSIRKLDRLDSLVEDNIQSTKNAINRMTRLLHEEVSKDSMQFSEVVALKPKWDGEPEEIFLGKRVFRIEDENGYLKLERSKTDIRFVIRWGQDCASFHYPIEHINILKDWLLK